MTTPQSPHGANAEPHQTEVGSKLNWLRAGVLGANDGIVSVAGLLTGVAATGAGGREILVAGSAALISGAVSMALGEYVSVSAQRDTEKMLGEKERWELENLPEEEHAELVQILMDKGMEKDTAEVAAVQMHEHNALRAHLQLELGMDEEDFTNPWVAAGASAVAFTVGALLPLIVSLIVPDGWRVAAVLISALLALSVTGTISAKFSEANKTRSVIRLVVGGALAFGVTYVIGALLGTTVAA